MTNPEEVEELRTLIRRHGELTQSQRAWKVLAFWDEILPKLVKVMPKDYKRVLESLEKIKESGKSGDEAIMAAFELNARDAARVGGG